MGGCFFSRRTLLAVTLAAWFGKNYGRCRSVRHGKAVFRGVPIRRNREPSVLSDISSIYLGNGPVLRVSELATEFGGLWYTLNVRDGPSWVADGIHPALTLTPVGQRELFDVTFPGGCHAARERASVRGRLTGHLWPRCRRVTASTENAKNGDTWDDEAERTA